MMHFFFVVRKRDSSTGVRILGGEVCDLWYCDVKRADADVTKMVRGVGSLLTTVDRYRVVAEVQLVSC